MVEKFLKLTVLIFFIIFCGQFCASDKKQDNVEEIAGQMTACSLNKFSTKLFIKTRENPVDAFLRPGMNRVN